MRTITALLYKTSMPPEPRAAWTTVTESLIDASDVTSTGTMCSVPCAVLLSARRVVALSGLRQVAITVFVGTESSCLVSSRPMPRFALEKGG